ncbi:hypothetical protein UFOVP74_50 [uncultured Caudovirales phage]|uniref:Uncharacterized protein n=1 Tax=uncultured Caudovirales phage TaxID=2100421 RepID=A0A6J5KZW1_9CAUD|nr:hypothetical protein UFOVP74_50 [uncultured Caudovirales phage]
MIVTHSANGREFMIVEVHPCSANHDVWHDQLHYQLAPQLNVNDPMYSEDLLPGNYNILFIAETATEEQAERVILKNWTGDLLKGMNGSGGEGWVPENGYWNYEGGECDFECASAIDSLHSLIRANFTDTTKHHLILEVIK